MKTIIVILLFVVTSVTYCQVSFQDIGNSRLIDTNGRLYVIPKPGRTLGSFNVIKPLIADSSFTVNGVSTFLGKIIGDINITGDFLVNDVPLTTSTDTSLLLHKYDSLRFPLRLWSINGHYLSGSFSITKSDLGIDTTAYFIRSLNNTLSGLNTFSGYKNTFKSLYLTSGGNDTIKVTDNNDLVYSIGDTTRATLTKLGNFNLQSDLNLNTRYLKLTLGALSTFPTIYAGLWLAQASPSASNYLLLGSASQSFINAPSANIQFRVGNATFLSVGGTGLEITSTGNTTPSGSRLKIMAGSSTVSLINLTSGTLKSSSVAGDLEFNTDNLYFTQTTNTAKNTIALNRADTMSTYSSSVTVPMNGSLKKVATNQNCTLNATGGVAGSSIVFYFSNSSGADRTITFGTNFKTASTLVVGYATAGTDEATITFICLDGTTWVETARIGAF